MNTIEAIQARRSVKHFDPFHLMTEAQEKELLSLAMLSPTAFNIQHWKFVVIKDVELRKQIKAAAWNQDQVTDSSLFIVVCADLKAWEKNPSRYWVNAPKEVGEFMVPAIDGYYRGNDRAQRDEAMRSCGIAAQTLMLATKAMGYDSCPMDGFDFEKVGKLINLPDDHLIALCVAIGKAVEPARPRGGQLEMDEVILTDRF